MKPTGTDNGPSCDCAPDHPGIYTYHLDASDDGNPGIALYRAKCVSCGTLVSFWGEDKDPDVAVLVEAHAASDRPTGVRVAQLESRMQEVEQAPCFQRCGELEARMKREEKRVNGNHWELEDWAHKSHSATQGRIDSVERIADVLSRQVAKLDEAARLDMTEARVDKLTYNHCLHEGVQTKFLDRIRTLETRANTVDRSIFKILDKVSALEAVTTDNGQNIEGLAREQDGVALSVLRCVATWHAAHAGVLTRMPDDLYRRVKNAIHDLSK